MTEGYYKARGAYVLARAGRRHGARRRGEQLMAKARRIERDAVGAGDAAAAETVTPNLWMRRIHRREDSGVGAVVVTALWMLLIIVLVGPALLIAKAIYALRFALVSRLGPMRAWPWLVTAAVALVGAVVTWQLWPPEIAEARLWLCVQGVGAPVRVAYLVYAYGWQGVSRAKSSVAPVVVVGPVAEDGPEIVVELDDEMEAPAVTAAEGPVVEIGYDDAADASVVMELKEDY